MFILLSSCRSSCTENDFTPIILDAPTYLEQNKPTEKLRSKFNLQEEKSQLLALESLLKLRTQSRQMRATSLAFLSWYEDARANEHILTALDLEDIFSTAKTHLQVRKKLFQLVNHYASLSWQENGLCDLRNRRRGSLIALAAAAQLYDNFQLCFAAIAEHDDLRQVIDRGDPGFQIAPGQMSKTMHSYFSVRQRSTLREQLDYLSSHRQKLAIKQDKSLQTLLELIDASPACSGILDSNSLNDLAKKSLKRLTYSTDKIVSSSISSMGEVSGSFGNVVGLVATRRGYLDAQPKLTKQLKSQLQPLDVLLEKTPFRLTDRFIPGHFGHVAIWLGTEAQLRKTGLWQHPLLVPHHQAIREGRCVLEALRDGVQLNSLDHFLNIDDLAVLRPNFLKTSDQRKLALSRALRQMGKAYDFNFDVETSDCIVCSELAYQVFPQVKWPLTKTLGRYTISPDQVAFKALKHAQDNADFSLAMLYHQGKKIALDNAAQRLRQLVLIDSAKQVPSLKISPIKKLKSE